MRTLKSWYHQIERVSDAHSSTAVAAAKALVDAYSGGQTTAVSKHDLALEYQRRGYTPDIWEVIADADRA